MSQIFTFHNINIGMKSRILMLNQGHTECAVKRDALKSSERQIKLLNRNTWNLLPALSTLFRSISVNFVRASLLHGEFVLCRVKNMLSERGGCGGGGVLLAFLHPHSVVNIFILSVRVGFELRGTSHSGSSTLCEHQCDCKRHFHLYYGSKDSPPPWPLHHFTSSMVLCVLCEHAWLLRMCLRTE